MLHAYREFQPARALRRYVECYWEASSEARSGLRATELLVPDLRIELILNAAEPYLWAPRSSEPANRSPDFACLGMRGTSLAIRQPGRLAHFSVRFRPAGLAFFARLPLGELTERCVDARELWARGSDELAERLLEARSGEERTRIADAFLLSKLTVRGELAHAAALCFVDSRGTAEIGSVAHAHGVGYKNLERAFFRDVGLSPKHFARVARLQHSMAVFAATPRISLAALAARSGYADQAHFTREFKRLVGRAPGAFFRERFTVFETMKESGSIGLKPLEDEPSD